MISFYYDSKFEIFLFSVRRGRESEFFSKNLNLKKKKNVFGDGVGGARGCDLFYKESKSIFFFFFFFFFFFVAGAGDSGRQEQVIFCTKYQKSKIIIVIIIIIIIFFLGGGIGGGWGS